MIKIHTKLSMLNNLPSLNIRFFALALLISGSIVNLGYSSPVEAEQLEESYEDCLDRQQQATVQKRRRAGRRDKARLADIVCQREQEKSGKNLLDVRKHVNSSNSKPELPVAARQARSKSRTVSPVPVLTNAQINANNPIAIPDRWRLMNSLGYQENWLDPYNRNVLKGDAPVIGNDWFFATTVISDTVIEPRRVVTPVGGQSTGSPGQIDVYGSGEQLVVSESVIAELVFYKGDTVFRPPDYEFRFTPVFNINYLELDEILGVNVDPRDGRDRTDTHVGIQAAFFDYHLRNVSPRFDFDSIRIGIQPFNADFRGFLFNDSPLGVRLFGTRDNNIFQYNLAWFRRVEKDTNSGLNDIGESLRNDDIFVANLFWQDLGVKGFNSSFLALYNRNTEDEVFYDTNGFIQRPASFGEERPREYDAMYLGYSGDGHIGRMNLSASLYHVFGEEERGPLNNGLESDISAWFFGAEAGFDMDWIRVRGSVAWASGDSDPYDDLSEGFDAIFENPLFAGADTSYWIRQGVPLVGGGRVALSSRNGLQNSLRSSKEHGQSNFTNPGLRLLGVGTDLDLLPELRVSFNLNQLWFDEMAVLEVVRQQNDIDSNIGTDVSTAIIWRPWMHQNVVVRLSYAQLIPAQGYKDLYGDDESPYSLLANLILTY